MRKIIFVFAFLDLIIQAQGLGQQIINRGNELLRGPYLQSATPNSIIIRWRTRTAGKARVRYSLLPEKLESSKDDTVSVQEHIITLTGLKSNTSYYYEIESTGSQVYKSKSIFKTLPPAGTTGFYRIAAVGDCGNNSVNQHAVRDQLLHYLGKKNLDAWILLGDNAYPSGRDAEFQMNFFNVYRNDLLPRYPLFPAPGNHDYSDGDSIHEKSSQITHQVAYYADFSLPDKGEAGGIASNNPAFYSFDLGNIHFLSLDSYGLEENKYRIYDTLGPQVEWIKKDLEANRNRGWIIAYWHHPPFTMGSHNSDQEEELVHIRENFIRILERLGVDLILCGHSHDYERSKLQFGYYGSNALFDPEKYQMSQSSGFYDGSPNSCPYIKDSSNGFLGTVYVVSGSAGQLGGKQHNFPHRALPYSNADQGGVSVLEIADNRLDLKWICADGKIRDHFTMMKQVNHKLSFHIKKGQSVVLTASYIGRYHWNTSPSGNKSIRVSPDRNEHYEVKDDMNCLKDQFDIYVN